MTVKDHGADQLIPKVAAALKKTDVKPPAWATFVKTGVSQERPPQQADWWYLRAAAILRKVYLTGPVGVSRLRTAYGGKRRRGHKPPHHRKAGGKIIRLMLQQLQSGGFIQMVEKPRKGRTVTSKGQRLLDRLAK